MAAHTVNLVGYVLVSLILLGSIGFLISQKIDAINKSDYYQMVYAASDLALILDAVYAAPNQISYVYDLNISGIDYSIDEGIVVVKKTNVMGPAAKKAYHRFGFSNITKFDETSLSYANDSVSMSILASNKRIFVSKLDSNAVSSLENQKKSCPVVDTSWTGLDSYILLDFPIISDMNDEKKDSAVISNSILSFLSTSKTKNYKLLRMGVTTSSTFDNTITESANKKFYLFLSSDDSKEEINIYLKQSSDKYNKFSCILENELSKYANVKINYGFTGDLEKFNQVQSDYVVVLILGKNFGSPYALAESLKSAFEEFFK